MTVHTLRPRHGALWIIDGATEADTLTRTLQELHPGTTPTTPPTKGHRP